MGGNVSELITAIRNASRLRKPMLTVGHSKFYESIVAALVRAGYVWRYTLGEDSGVKIMNIALRYSGDLQPAIDNVTVCSRSGRRMYVGVGQIPVVQQGLGVAVLSTSKGVLFDSEAKRENVGGELLCTVF